MKEQNYFGRTGWICPVCGRGMSPYESFCPCKSGEAENIVTGTSACGQALDWGESE